MFVCGRYQSRPCRIVEKRGKYGCLDIATLRYDISSLIGDDNCIRFDLCDLRLYLKNILEWSDVCIKDGKYVSASFV